MALSCLLHEDSQRVNLVITATTFAETALALTEKKINTYVASDGWKDLVKTLLGTLSKEILRKLSQSD